MCVEFSVKHLSASYHPTQSSPRVWTLACPHMDSWHIGKHHQGNTTTKLKSEKWAFLLLTEHETVNIYLRFHRQILGDYSSVFLHCLVPAPQRDHMCYTKIPYNILLKCLPNVHCKVNQSLQSNIVLCLKSWAVTSPVLAGFLLLVISSAAGCFQRSWVRLLQVLFIQKCVGVHQILKTGRKQGEWEGLVKPSYSLMSLYVGPNIHYLPHRRHPCHWLTASTFWLCWGQEQLSLLQPQRLANVITSCYFDSSSAKYSWLWFWSITFTCSGLQVRIKCF